MFCEEGEMNMHEWSEWKVYSESNLHYCNGIVAILSQRAMQTGYLRIWKNVYTASFCLPILYIFVVSMAQLHDLCIIHSRASMSHTELPYPYVQTRTIRANLMIVAQTLVYIRIFTWLLCHVQLPAWYGVRACSPNTSTNYVKNKTHQVNSVKKPYLCSYRWCTLGNQNISFFLEVEMTRLYICACMQRVFINLQC